MALQCALLVGVHGAESDGDIIGDGIRATSMQQLTPTTFQVGAVVLDKVNRTVTVPAQVNLREGLIEYALVTESGKIHESLLITRTRPADIHVACLLLGAKPIDLNRGLERIMTNAPESMVQLDVQWDDPDGAKSYPLERLVSLRTASPRGSPQSRARLNWLYNGSIVPGGQFLGGRSGSIVSLITDPVALINNPRPDRADDEIHVPNTARLPAEETSVKVIIRLPQLLGKSD